MVRGDTDLSVEDLQRSLSQVSPTRFTAQYVQEIQKFMGMHHYQQQQQPRYQNQPHHYQPGQSQQGQQTPYGFHGSSSSNGGDFHPSSTETTSTTSKSDNPGVVDPEVFFFTNKDIDGWDSSADSDDFDDDETDMIFDEDGEM